LPALEWLRQIPIGGEPAEVVREFVIDLPLRHHTHVTCRRDDAAAGDCVTVDGGQHRARMVKDRHKGPRERRQEFPNVGLPASHDPLQVDTGGERGPVPGDHHRPVLVHIAHGRGDRLQEV
jgi:hypothetical protein